MTDEKLAHQANQIAAYFQVYPEQRARDGVLEHIRKFWPPAKRTALLALAETDDAELHPLVQHAATVLRNG